MKVYVVMSYDEFVKIFSTREKANNFIEDTLKSEFEFFKNPDFDLGSLTYRTDTYENFKEDFNMYRVLEIEVD